MANSNWSAENAAKAFIKTMKMGKGVKEPDVSEFVSALAAGNNAKLMVAACGVDTTGISTVLALLAAANLTDGKVVCILRSPEEINKYRSMLGENVQVEFSVGEAESLMVSEYKESDFVVVDCNLYDHAKMSRLVQTGGAAAAIVLGYNALSNKSGMSWSWGSDDSKAVQLLPIGEGLLLSRITGKGDRRRRKNGGGNWVVKVDKCTGEEHVFRVRSHGRTIAC
ncbi:uncharacterized protein LOC124932722 [Impatiens glandulifera]|uniref:uncharacterized protein LOC124932722 n=1 Tax=Impatiens glandulifera TaxID=253017 RepID=UPI001FB193BB|nr:uncharacterized protein LOC124932722 [Impatiens glandulifera]